MDDQINYNRVKEAIEYLLSHHTSQPRLEDVAGEVHLSEYHFQRIFSEWAGISPKKFLKYLTIESLKNDLRETNDLVEAAGRAGLSSQSRVHDLFVSVEAVTPAEFRSNGRGVEIKYGFHESPFGDCFIAQTARGICAISFVEATRDRVLEEFRQKWVNASITEDIHSTAKVAGKLFDLNNPGRKFHLLLKGTPFQLKVWEALLKIPMGLVTSYGSLASAIGKPGAMRAVGSAVGSNPVSYLIPCHRVIRSEGIIGNYHWGPLRKTAMLGWEKAKAEL